MSTEKLAERVEQTKWASDIMVLLAHHYGESQIDVIVGIDQFPFYLYVDRDEIGRGETLGKALENAVSRLTDEELLRAAEQSKLE